MIRGAVFDLGETLISFQGSWEAVFRESRAQLIAYLGFIVGEFDQEEFDLRLKRAIERAQSEREQDYRERPLTSILAETLDDAGLDSLTSDEMKQAMQVMFGPSEAAWTPVRNVGQILGRIKESGLRLGLISNASDTANVHRHIEKARIASFFDPILVSAEHGWRKPAPQIFESLLEEWDLPPREVVMIGDTLGADILGAQRMGMRNIWVRSAAAREDNVALVGQVVPERSVERLGEVEQILRGWRTAGLRPTSHR